MKSKFNKYLETSDYEYNEIFGWSKKEKLNKAWDQAEDEDWDRHDAKMAEYDAKSADKKRLIAKHANYSFEQLKECIKYGYIYDSTLFELIKISEKLGGYDEDKKIEAFVYNPQNEKRSISINVPTHLTKKYSITNKYKIRAIFHIYIVRLLDRDLFEKIGTNISYRQPR